MERSREVERQVNCSFVQTKECLQVMLVARVVTVYPQTRHMITVHLTFQGSLFFLSISACYHVPHSLLIAGLCAGKS